MTLDSSDTGVSVRLFAVAAFWVAAPHGTSGEQMTSFFPSREELKPVTAPGLSAGVMSTR